jgi:peptidoglycan/LPS O-acetylase OafA/YrhL
VFTSRYRRCQGINFLICGSDLYRSHRPVRYRPDADGLRAFAIASVVFFHVGFDAFPGGFVGVDIFFVISGFLITGFIINNLR